MSVPNGMLALLQPLLVATADHAEAHLQLALALERQGASAEARQHFDEARRLAPYLGTQPRAAGRPSAALPVPHP